MRPLLACLLVTACHPGNVAAPPRDADFDALATRYLDGTLELYPSEGVRMGLHQYDGRLPDFSPAGIDRQRAFFTGLCAELDRSDPARLSVQGRVERDTLRAQCRGRLFTIAVRRAPYREPTWYADLFDPLYYMREYAPLATRARGLAAMLRAAPGLVDQIEGNLEARLPRVWLKVAQGQAQGGAAFLRADLRAAFAGLAKEDAALARELDAAIEAAAARFERHVAFLAAREQDASDDGWALGADGFHQVMEIQGVDLSLEDFARVADEALAADRAALVEAARQVDPAKSVEQVIAELPGVTPEQVIAQAGEDVAMLRSFVIEHKIVSVPFEDVPQVRATPPFMRYNFAFFDGSGIFEPKATASYFFVTPPDPSWPRAQQVAYLGSRGSLLFTTVHEVWPGHFTQSLFGRKNTSRTLRSVFNYSVGEGWAHYSEEMMWEQGLGGGDPRAHLAMLIGLLRRDVRAVAAIGLHTRGWTLEYAARRFREDGYADEQNARQQAARGTFDPAYFGYMVGRLAIKKLREDVKRRRGAAFDLRAFHDEVLSYGAGAPISAIRRAMLGDDAGPVL